VDDLAIAVELLAEALHDQLLEIAAEHLQPVAVGQNHHVALALSATGGVPSGGEERRRVVIEIANARHRIHLGRTGEELADVRTDQDPREQTHGTGDARATTDPIEHVEAGQPAGIFGFAVELAVDHGHGHGLLGPATAGCFNGPAGLQHADVGFRGAAGFADDDHQGGLQTRANGRQGAAHPIGIDVVEEMERQACTRVLKGPDHQQGTETRATDANPKDVGEGVTGRIANGTAQDVTAKGFDPIHFGLNVGTAGGIRSELG